MVDGALTGLKVLDLTQHIAGPYGTKLLASLGASVLKVERPRIGDVLRHIGPFYEDVPGADRSAPFLYVNTDKQGITLNLKSPTGAQMLGELIRWADVVVESFRPGVMAGLGFSYAAIEAINPSAILVSVSNFGQTGPYRDYQLTDLTAQALGGLMNEMGEPDGVPLKLGGYQALYATGVAAFTGAMIASVSRKMTGVGQHVDVSIHEMMAYTEWHASCFYTYTGAERHRQGRYNQWKILRTGNDGYMGVVGRWPELKAFLGDAVANDSRFDTPEGRVEHTLELGELIEAAMADRDKVDLYHEGQAAGIPWGYVASMTDVMESPHYAARDFFRSIVHPEVGSGCYAGMPFRISDTSSGPWAPAPRLGQHNELVYGELFGLKRCELGRLHEMGVI